MISPRDNPTGDSLTDTLDAPVSVVTTLSSFIAISWYNTLAINVVILLVFKRWGGLYFYSLMIASWGIVLHQLGFLLQFFGLVGTFAESYVVMMVGWYAMTTSQAVVLYSRLHLITRDAWKFRWVLYMIICNAILFHIPTTIFLAMTNTKPELIPPFNIWQNIQVTAFSIQEFILAGLYIYEARSVLRPSKEFRKAKVGQVMRNLIYVNILVIILDIAVMCTQYVGMYEVHVVFKAAVYSVKLFVEFFVLNQLTEITGSGMLTEESDGYLSSLNHHGTTICKRASIAPSHSAAGMEAGDPQDYFFPGKGGTDSPVDTASKSQVSRTSENDTSLLVPAAHTGEGQTGENEKAHASAAIRKGDEWIELS